MSGPRSFPALVARYLEWMAVHHYSKWTVKQAGHMLRSFVAWCAERTLARPADVTRQDLERYQRWLFHYRKKNGRPLSRFTQQERLVRVRCFFKWLARERYLEYDPASALELPKRPPRLPTDLFTREEVEQVLATPDTDKPVGLRDRAILETLYSTGVRRLEAVSLDVHDLDPDRGVLAIRQGKGGRDRVVPIGERALAWLDRYLEEVRSAWVPWPDEKALFVTIAGHRMSYSGLGQRVRDMIELSGIRLRRGACHLFRHTMATQMLEAGADIRYIQEMLGHARLDTTQVYTRVAIRKLKAIHTATHPGANLGRRDGRDAGDVGGTEDLADDDHEDLAGNDAEDLDDLEEPDDELRFLDDLATERELRDGPEPGPPG